MLALFASASAVLNSVVPQATVWNSLNHDFACDLRTVQGHTIRLVGSAIETVTDIEGKLRTKGQFDFGAVENGWKFLNGRAPTSGGGLLGSHTIHVDNIDDPSVAGFKPYSIQLTFSNRIDGLSGPYGYAVLRDQSTGTNRVRQGSDYPIAAVGVCLMTPKAGAGK